MSDAQKDAVRNYRARLTREGLSRVEVLVTKEDVPIVRDVAKALADPERAPLIRAALQPRSSVYAGMSLKQLLENAPLEGVDLSRSKALGRDVEL